MPKSDADYSNTIIYKITCNDAQVTDVYVGHTTNFVQRKHAHRLNCVNNNCKVYKVIRANGGWTNWSMDIINFFKCKDQYEARIKEQEYFLLLNATLNSVEPFHTPVIKAIVDKTLFFCEPCNIQFESQKMLDVHCNTRKHKKQVLTPEDLIEDPQHVVKFHCDICQFHCSKQSNYAMHLLTQKHVLNVDVDVVKDSPRTVLYECTKCQFSCSKLNNYNVHLNTRKHNMLQTQETAIDGFSCKKCKKIYKARNSLWYHEQTCKNSNDIIPHEDINIKQLLQEVVKNNSEMQKKHFELQKQLLEICKKKSWSAE